MSPRDWKMRVEHILEAISAISEYARGMDLHAFQADRRTVDAVMKNIIVIGEAARAMPKEVVTRYSDIPWNDMRDMWNAVVHVYFEIRTEILWDTIQKNLPPLVPLLRKLLED